MLSFLINKNLAEAIIDMENIGFGESLGAESLKGCEEWRKLVEFVAKGFDLQDRVLDKRSK